MKHRIRSLVTLAGIAAALLLASCSNPWGAPDPFDQALGSIMAQRAALFQARAMNEENRNGGRYP